MVDIIRIKWVPVGKKRTSKCLSEQLGVTPSTVSKWCTTPMKEKKRFHMACESIINLANGIIDVHLYLKISK